MDVLSFVKFKRQVYGGAILNTAERLELPISDTAPRIRRHVQPRHTSDAQVGSVDAQELDAFYGDLRSPIQQLRALNPLWSTFRGVLYRLVGAWLRNRPICKASKYPKKHLNHFEITLHR